MHLINITDEGKRFIDEWENGKDYVVAHTSGSTGTPKEILLPKADMACSAQATIRRFGITSESRMLCPLSASYIAGKMMIVRALLSGCELIMEQPSNHPLHSDYGKIDLMAVVPSQCHGLLQNRYAGKFLRNLIVGGAPLTYELEHALCRMPWQTFATYGMTETCSHVALRKTGSRSYTAMPGITFSIDNRGCLIINAPEYSFGKLATNDIVELSSADSFKWLGRFDNVINSGGIKFYPEQLEKLLEHAFDFPFFFKGMPDSKWGEAIEMIIECQDADKRTHIISQAEKACMQHLPHHAIPKRITIVDALPRTDNGKLLRI